MLSGKEADASPLSLFCYHHAAVDFLQLPRHPPSVPVRLVRARALSVLPYRLDVQAITRDMRLRQLTSLLLSSSHRYML